MKLLNFKAQGRTWFGAAIDGYAFSFSSLQDQEGTRVSGLDSIYTYLENLPESFENASALCLAARTRVQKGRTEGAYPIADVKILPPIPRPAALLDFALTPNHLVNSTRTMLKYEWGPLMSRVVTALLAKRLHAMCRSETPPYYKGNHLSVIGDGDEIGWPFYTSYLDIEPELSVVTGTPRCPIAGYTIFNDASARDIQFPEMFGSGPARAKDFPRGNGLGPYLVTPDEVPSPRSLNVTVTIGTRYSWRGSSSEYTLAPDALVEYVRRIYPFHPGIVLGMGTIPGCTGLDNDQWINPGEEVHITFDRLGTLHQRIPENPAILEKSRWPKRW